MLVHITRLLAHEGASVKEAVPDAQTATARLFPKAQHLTELTALIERAICLSTDGSVDDLSAIRALGQGWVAEETLAIAVFCALRYENDFERALIAAVSHGGDSDSTGSVAGQILGAHLGLEAIPEKFLTHLELKHVILEIADGLFSGCRMDGYRFADDTWEEKYIRHTYRPAQIKNGLPLLQKSVFCMLFTCSGRFPPARACRSDSFRQDR